MIGRRARFGIAATTLATAALLLGSCSSESSSAHRGDEPAVTPRKGQTISTPANAPFTIRLASNPTTGYEWTVAPIDGTVHLVESKYEPPRSRSLGAPSAQLLTFDAGPPGRSVVSLSYVRPFGAEGPAKALGFTVVVTKA